MPRFQARTIGGGAQDAFAEIVAEAMLREEQARRAQQQQFENEQSIGDRMENARRFDLGQAAEATERAERQRVTDFNFARQQKQDERQAAADRQANNERGVLDMAATGVEMGTVNPRDAEGRRTLGAMLMRAGENKGLDMLTQPTQDEEDARALRLFEEQERLRAKYRPAPKGDNTPPKLPAAMADKVAAAQTSLAALDQLEALFSDDFVGPVAGRYNKTNSASPSVPVLGALVPDAPEGFDDFAAETATLKNQVIQAITGAAVGVQEQGRIMGQIPDLTDPPQVWRAKAKATRRNLQELMANQVQMGTGAQPALQGGETVNVGAGGVNSALAELERRRKARGGTQ